MKNTLITFGAAAISAAAVNGATILSEGFESDGEGVRYTSTGVFNSSTQDYWGREDTTSTDRVYTGIGGSFFYGGQDTVGGEQLLVSVNIAGFNNLNFSANFAEQRPEASGADDIDSGDFALIEFQIDGGGFQNLLSFKNDGSTFNTTFQQDTDFDGTGDGSQLETAFANFSANIAGTGTTLDIRLTASVDSGDEDIAIDDILITGDPVPEPSSTALLGLGGLALLARRRR